MASIWTQGPRSAPQKLEGNLPAHPDLVSAVLEKWSRKLAKANNAKVCRTEPFEVLLQWPDGALFSVYAELLSPPSKADVHEPRPAKEARK